MHNPSLGLVLHVIEGSLSAADSAFHNPSWRASAHFGIGNDGRLVQWVDTADKAWAEVAGNPDYHSVETEGWDTMGLTVAQTATLARLYRWGHDTFGWPYELADVPGQRGLAWHGMGGDAWGGHFGCPGTTRRQQRAGVLALAQGGGEDDVWDTNQQREIDGIKDKLNEAHDAVRRLEEFSRLLAQKEGIAYPSN